MSAEISFREISQMESAPVSERHSRPPIGAFSVWIAAVGFLAVLAGAVWRVRMRLGEPALVSGWSLLTVMIVLAVFNARKRLSMVPLGSAAAWLRIHVAGGALAVGIFWLHTGRLWPTGAAERLLAALFYLVSLSGLIGIALQRLYPPRLTQSGLEIVYERIPAELSEIRQRAESLVLGCTKETGNEILAQHYLQTLDWFFRRPRFFASHAWGGQKAAYWVRHQCSTVRRYLNEAERGYLDQLSALAELKNRIDLHYAAQSLMKGWLLAHLPLAAAVMVLAAWHVVLVHIYRI